MHVIKFLDSKLRTLVWDISTPIMCHDLWNSYFYLFPEVYLCVLALKKTSLKLFSRFNFYLYFIEHWIYLDVLRIETQTEYIYNPKLHVPKKNKNWRMRQRRPHNKCYFKNLHSFYSRLTLILYPNNYFSDARDPWHHVINKHRIH